MTAIEQRVGSRLVVVLLVASMLAVSCRSAPDESPVGEMGLEGGDAIDEETELEGDGPKRIILFVGDGMGFPAIALAAYSVGEPLAMMGMDEAAMMTTHESEFVTTDSAASATAIATGEKTHFNGVSVRPGTTSESESVVANQLPHMIDAAQRAGWRTGLVATSRINHATPGAFAAHRSHRHQYEDIALDMSESGVNLLLGAGYDFFRNRDDDRDLLEEMGGRGYRIGTTGDAVREANGPGVDLVGLMHPRDMPWQSTGERAMELAEMVELALENLGGDDDDSFFLMVEGSFIDWGGHRLDRQKIYDEMMDFDRAVGVALDYAESRSDTLVVVTSDHETGAMDVVDEHTAQEFLAVLGDESEMYRKTLPEHLHGPEREEYSLPVDLLEGGTGSFGPDSADGSAKVGAAFGYFSAASRAHWDGRGRFSGIHTPLWVPLMAQGQGAREVATVRDNADLGRQLMTWIDGEHRDLGWAQRRRDATSVTGEKPANLVIIIGDGVGIGALTAGYYHLGKPAQFEMAHSAMVATHGRSQVVSDRGEAATSLAGEDGEVGQGLLRRSLQGGRSIGVVTTGNFYSPAMAPFFGVPAGSDEVGAMASVLVGLGEEAEQANRGALFVGGGGPWSAMSFGDELKQSVGQSRGFREGDRGSLSERVEDSLAVLGSLGDGFVLVVEASGVAEAMADLDRGPRIMGEIAEFEAAVATALEFAASRADTLVVTTSLGDKTLTVYDNHYGFHSGHCGAMAECGGAVETHWFEVVGDSLRHGEGFENRALQGDFGAPRIGLQYSWMVEEAARRGTPRSARSANFVPLFANGPGAWRFAGFMDQIQIGQEFTELIQ